MDTPFTEAIHGVFCAPACSPAIDACRLDAVIIQLIHSDLDIFGVIEETMHFSGFSPARILRRLANFSLCAERI